MEQLTEVPGGVELIRAIFDGRLPPPGLAVLLGLEGVSADPGRVTFALEPRPEHANPMGTVHGGVLTSLLDSAMTCAVQSMLPAGDGATTLDLSVRFLRPVLPGGGRIECEGLAVHVGGRIATAEARVTDAEGRLLATATTSCMILRGER